MGMVAYIHRSALADCSNGGLSSRAVRVVVVNVSGPFEPTDEMPAVRLVKRGKTVHAEPVEPVADGNVGYMAGGAFISTSDSRFTEAVGFYGAVAFHDRQETPAQYELLSR